MRHSAVTRLPAVASVVRPEEISPKSVVGDVVRSKSQTRIPNCNEPAASAVNAAVMPDESGAGATVRTRMMSPATRVPVPKSSFTFGSVIVYVAAVPSATVVDSVRPSSKDQTKVPPVTPMVQPVMIRT